MRKSMVALGMALLFSGLASAFLLAAIAAGLFVESQRWVMGFAIAAFACLGIHEWAFRRHLADSKDKPPR